MKQLAAREEGGKVSVLGNTQFAACDPARGSRAICAKFLVFAVSFAEVSFSFWLVII